MECIKCNLACKVIFSRGRMWCFEKSGAVCSLYEELVTMRNAFFWILVSFSRLDLLVQL